MLFSDKIKMWYLLTSRNAESWGKAGVQYQVLESFGSTQSLTCGGP